MTEPREPVGIEADIEAAVEEVARLSSCVPPFFSMTYRQFCAINGDLHLGIDPGSRVHLGNGEAWHESDCEMEGCPWH